MPNQEIGSSGEVKWLQLISKQIIQLTGTVSAISGGGGGGIVGSGLTNYITRWSSATGVTNSQIYDNGTNVMIGTTTDSGGKLQVVGLVNAGGYAIPGGLSTQFLKADGTIDSTAYALDANLVHRTGDEAITGKKSFQNSGGSAQIIMNTTGGSGANAPLYITNPGKGHGLYVANQSTGSGIGVAATDGFGILVSNSGVYSGISVTNESIGNAFNVYNTGTGFSYIATDGGVTTFSVNKTGTILGNVLLLGGAADNTVDKLIVKGSASTTLDATINGVRIGKSSGHVSVNTNVTIGQNVYLNSTTGGNNVVIGTNSFTNASNAGSNVVIGQQILAGVSTNSTQYNVGIGYRALNATVAGRNIGIGYQALYKNTTGIENVAIGYNCSDALTTGNGNVSMGANTGHANLTGSNNTILGTFSGVNFSTGDNNVCLGYAAGSYLNSKSTGLFTVNNSIFIGQFTSALTDASTNQIVIGDNANGAGSNTTVLGNDLVVMTAIKGRTIIGQTGTINDDATNTLQVNGTAIATGYKIPGGLGTQFLMANGTTTSGGAGISGSGTANTLTKWTGAGTVGNSTITDASNTVNVGALNFKSRRSTIERLTVDDGFDGTQAYLQFSAAGTQFGLIASDIALNPIDPLMNLCINVYPTGDFNIRTNNVKRFIIKDAGNILIGGTTDDSINKLQVTGTVLATGYRTPGGLATQFLKADGSVSATTTLGANLTQFTDPNAETFIRINADNTLSALDAATFRTSIGAVGTSGTYGISVTGSAASLSANLPVNRLNSGTNASATTYWRGDGAWVSPFLSASALLDFPNTASGNSSDLTIPLVGAALGDVVILGAPNGSVIAGSDYFAWVSAVNTVSVRFNNYGAGAKNPAVGTFKVTIIK